MTAIPTFFLGRNTAALTITPQTVDAYGNLSPGATQSILASSKEFTMNIKNEVENVTSIGMRRQNNVVLETGYTYTIQGLVNSQDALNQMAALWATYDVYYFTLQRAGRTWSGYGVLVDFQEQFQKGPCNWSIEFAPVDPGAQNPAYA